MATPVRPSLLPQCTACARRLTNLASGGRRPIQQHVRGKKTSSQPDTITVRLLKDLETFGRKGAFVPISVGQMRNIWYPRRIAEYVTGPQLKELKAKNIDVARDFEFGTKEARKRQKALERQALEAKVQTVKEPKLSTREPFTKESVTKAVEPELLGPQRSTELLSILLPSRLDFYRTPIESEPAAPHASAPPPPPSKTQRAASAAASDLAAAFAAASAAAAPKPAPAPIAIYGSVSSIDIVTSIRALLAENDEASRIKISEEDIRFVAGPGIAEGEVENNRVKFLGDFEIRIKLKGATETVGRTVRVRKQSL